ncbi:MAG: PaaI family thioesterase [Pseudomonadota bacterium]
MSDQLEQILEEGGGLQITLGYINHIYADRCEAHLKLDHRHKNRRNHLHGGVHAALLDSALGYAASRAYDDQASQLVVTLSLNVNYLAATKSDTIKATGRTRRSGRSVCFCEGEVTDEDGVVLATATGVFKKVG